MTPIPFHNSLNTSARGPGELLTAHSWSGPFSLAVIPVMSQKLSGSPAVAIPPSSPPHAVFSWLILPFLGTQGLPLPQYHPLGLFLSALYCSAHSPSFHGACGQQLLPQMKQCHQDHLLVTFPGRPGSLCLFVKLLKPCKHLDFLATNHSTQ